MTQQDNDEKMLGEILIDGVYVSIQDAIADSVRENRVVHAEGTVEDCAAVESAADDYTWADRTLDARGSDWRLRVVVVTDNHADTGDAYKIALEDGEI